jgi:adenylosuccinate synthase
VPVRVVVGAQWGDEGKGKVTDLLCEQADLVVRYQGGNNAGHTVENELGKFALHLVPSGILQPESRCFLGPQVVIDPVSLLEEIRLLEEQGIGVRHRLHISPRAHLVLPGHRALDAAREAARGTGKIGTTGKGIGPAYESRAARTGVRIGLARQPRRLREAVLAASAELERALTCYPDAKAPSAEEVDKAIQAVTALTPLVKDLAKSLAASAEEHRSILFEGAQGTFLDIDHGTYPFVTSSHCLAGFAAPSVGLPARTVDGVLAVFKAYTTRVGSGPFPTELDDANGEHLRSRGNEFGTTTGRPRRTGWFDAVIARTATRINGIDAVALTKLDVLDEFPEIRIATAYTMPDGVTNDLPDDADDLDLAQPVYETMPGWMSSTCGATSVAKLPEAARRYVERLQKLIGAPIVLISTGPRREETIIRREPPLSTWLPAFFA